MTTNIIFVFLFVSTCTICCCGYISLGEALRTCEMYRRNHKLCTLQCVLHLLLCWPHACAVSCPSWPLLHIYHISHALQLLFKQLAWHYSLCSPWENLGVCVGNLLTLLHCDVVGGRPLLLFSTPHPLRLVSTFYPLLWMGIWWQTHRMSLDVLTLILSCFERRTVFSTICLRRGLVPQG